jgi:outer membrane protein
MENAMQKSLMAVLIGSALLSVNVHAADLIQVYQQALANDAQYGSARAALAAGQERTPQGRAGLLPTIGLTGSSTHGSTETTLDVGASPPKQTGTTNTYTLQLSQPLFSWTAWQNYEQSKLAEAAAQAAFGQAQEDLITRVSQAYFDVLAAQDTLESTRAQKTAHAEQLASAKRNFEVGTQTITDTHEAQAAYDLDVALEIAAANDLENKRTALQAITGAAPGALAPLKTGVALTSPMPATIDPWVSSAESVNYGVVGAGLNLESAKRDIQKSRAGHLPTLNLIANTGKTNTIGLSQTTNAVGVSLNVPIFSGFAVNSRVRESIALEDRARNDLESARRNAAQAARQAFLGVTSGMAQVKALEAAEVSSQSALDSNKLGYQVGVRINIDVLNAQRQLYSTRTSLSKARYDTIVAGLRLKAAAGTLKEADLEPVNNLLQK